VPRTCRATAAFTLILALAVGCHIPRDAEGTLARVRNGTMRVGVSEHSPWVRLASEEPEGVEPALLRRWAKQLDARLEWVRGSEAALVEGLRQGAIDVLVTGLQRTTPFASKVALSQPYLTTRIHFAVGPGAMLPKEWAGHSVTVPPDQLTIKAAVLQTGAMPVESAELWRGSLVIAAYDFEIEAHDMQRAGPALAVERRVIATRPGESAFLLALDRFLQGLDEADVRRLAAEEAVP
jgi:polar amino acid transport system substrate-binding protein